ncbi:PE-PPE domain-containing protein [Rhodococcus sp. ACS1]|uniref:PE-PPE domain-containing protein n=1 Tax=Rhodococcus sp. ACS1 TaxID=2028570 RepID=UPI000BB15979|nr:PE-PPE domain-containing protein [Rhodococcus sp. ACS1]PBC38542.1 PE-PPE domain-containing protein [Rhodococcus sp. ACS1]
MIDVLTIPGTGEPGSPNGRPVGMIKNVTDLLPSNLFDCYQLDYPRSYGPVGPNLNPLGIDFEKSVAQGVNNAIQWIRDSPNPVGLIGYSQGSTVVTRILEMIARGELPDIEIAFAALIASPNRRPYDSLGGVADGYGIMGEHESWPVTFPIWELANTRDPITSLDAGSPLRDFYLITKSFSLSNPVTWGIDLLGFVLEQKRRSFLGTFNLGKWSKAWEDALDYALRGEHTMYADVDRYFPGTTHSYTTELALTIIEEFE